MSTWSKTGVTLIADDRYTNAESVLVGDYRSVTDPVLSYTDMTNETSEAGDTTLTDDTVVLELSFTCSQYSAINYAVFRFENRNTTTLELEIEWQLLNSSLYGGFTKD